MSHRQLVRLYVELLECRCNPAHIPLLVVPGQPGSLPIGVNDPTTAEQALLDFAYNLGADPNTLTADFTVSDIDITFPPPVGDVAFPVNQSSPYSGLIDALKSIGYVEGVDLFVAAHDWRMPVAPLDGVNDGYLSLVTASSITDNTFQYGVDYMGYWLMQASQAYSASHNGEALQAVNVIEHSEGHLLTRAYISSPAYGGSYVNSMGQTVQLPRIEQLTQAAPPNEGASLVFNWIINNYPGAGSDLNQGGLYDLLNAVYLSVVAGASVNGPDGTPAITASTIFNPALSGPDPLLFIQQYIPSFRDEMATYPILNGQPITDPNIRNDLLLDLNGGADPDAYLSAVGHVNTLLGQTGETPTTVTQMTGAGGEVVQIGNPLFTSTPTPPPTTWYMDSTTTNNGDTLIPKQAVQTLVDDPRAHFQWLPGITHESILTDFGALTKALDTIPAPTVVVGAGVGSVARMMDPQTGQVQFDATAFSPSFTGGVRTAMGDVNGDGMPDLITAAGPGGGPQVCVFDGRTGRQIDGPLGSFYAFESTMGSGVYVAAGDVNGDGDSDIVVSADAGGGPRVRVFSGRDGMVLFDFYAYDASFHGGVTVAVGDVNADGFADIITGAGPGGAPHVEVFSGRDRSMLSSFYAFDASFLGGVFLAAGDVNGNGAAEIAAGAGAGGGSNVRLFDMTANTAPQSFYAYDPSYSGGVHVGFALTVNGGASLVTGPGSGINSDVRVWNASLQSTSFDAFQGTYTGGIWIG